MLFYNFLTVYTSRKLCFRFLRVRILAYFKSFVTGLNVKKNVLASFYTNGWYRKKGNTNIRPVCKCIQCTTEEQHKCDMYCAKCKIRHFRLCERRVFLSRNCSCSYILVFWILFCLMILYNKLNLKSIWNDFFSAIFMKYWGKNIQNCFLAGDLNSIELLRSFSFGIQLCFKLKQIFMEK